ncbi:MAG TPA: hypothetical protein PK622_11340, partial [Saprospiraceae bacterium]|nr:hypothetical protein [Saprospiraceae bacterium]
LDIVHWKPILRWGTYITMIIVVLVYFNLNTGQKKNIVIQLTAAYRGKYEKASIVCEAMYDPNIFARQYTEQIVIR